MSAGAAALAVEEEPTLQAPCPFSLLGEEHEGTLYLARSPRTLFCERCGVALTVEAVDRVHYALEELVDLRGVIANRLEQRLAPVERRRLDRAEGERWEALRALERRLLRDYCADDGERGVRVAAALYLDAPGGWRP